MNLALISFLPRDLKMCVCNKAIHFYNSPLKLLHSKHKCNKTKKNNADDDNPASKQNQKAHGPYYSVVANPAPNNISR